MGVTNPMVSRPFLKPKPTLFLPHSFTNKYVLDGRINVLKVYTV